MEHGSTMLMMKLIMIIQDLPTMNMAGFTLKMVY